MNVPFVAQKSAVDTGQERPDPEYEEHIHKRIVDVLCVCFDSNGDSKNKADQQWTP